LPFSNESAQTAAISCPVVSSQEELRSVFPDLRDLFSPSSIFNRARSRFSQQKLPELKILPGSADSPFFALLIAPALLQRFVVGSHKDRAMGLRARHALSFMHAVMTLAPN
jgi:hypothetical protein